MQIIQTKQQYICYNPELLTETPEMAFSSEFWQQQNKIIGSAQGRGTTWFVQGEKLAMALRHYRRGGLFGKLVADSYLFSGWDKTRSVAEFSLLNHLIAHQVNVPKPVAARAVRLGWFRYQADILVEKIANSRDLVGILGQETLSQQVWFDVGAMIKRMHDAGVCHTDLNCHNILLDDHKTVWIIDFDKCYRLEGANWQEKNLARLHRSFIKEQGKRGILFNEDNWQWLLQGYHG
ncbi:3-deoxy-D-manno-octulosonic acid kinase [Photobacterium damselae]|uniref:3-deoxy-D-manno-octulosonic acid kinase n=1 Tax=Photobacterium damselae TaxID=38293 RepID=UPI000D072816|nr:3-deoxy-D-manno-octulosonic acid kinase [Photobacterium damselae]PSB78767.1 3-deoxy-D-manno-octulosonic acid kinase [Photobacterium damselae subsp. damselae]